MLVLDLPDKHVGSAQGLNLWLLRLLLLLILLRE